MTRSLKLFPPCCLLVSASPTTQIRSTAPTPALRNLRNSLPAARRLGRLSGLGARTFRDFSTIKSGMRAADRHGNGGFCEIVRALLRAVTRGDTPGDTPGRRLLGERHPAAIAGRPCRRQPGNPNERGSEL